MAGHTLQTSLEEQNKTLLTARLVKSDPYLQTFYFGKIPHTSEKLPYEVARLLIDVPESEVAYNLESDTEWD